MKQISKTMSNREIIDQVEKFCTKNRYQFTKLRKEILNLILSNNKPLKAYDILEKLQQIDRSAKPITIYRALHFFQKYNIIHKLESQNSFFCCIHPGKLHNCYFLVCNECNFVEEICKNDILGLVSASLKKDSFIIQHISLEIKGLCKNCFEKTHKI